jgi:hypothetical protein
MSDETKDGTTASVSMWKADKDWEDSTHYEVAGPAKEGGQPPDPDDERAKLREQWRRGRQTFYLTPEVSFVEAVERATRNGPQASAMEIRDLGTQGIAFRNAISWLTERLRYAMGERDVLEEHLRLERREHLIRKGLHLEVEKRLAEAISTVSDLRKAAKKAPRKLGK